jgi:DNA gyrase subunit B
MEYIENDIEKIQMKTGMYISYVGWRGALHLGKEVIQNAIDECANPKSPAKNIHITLDLDRDRLTVEDDGRGIPEDDFPMDVFCTKLNSGSKFTREQGGASSGENGVGNTAVCALSEEFIWASYRGGMEHKISFNSGKKVGDTTKKSKKIHGCILSFIPSKKYLGKTARIKLDELKKWIDSISYFIPKDCRIVFEAVKDNKVVEKITYKSRSMLDLLNSHITDERLTQTVSFEKSMNLEEDYRGERKIKRSLDLEFAFGYSDSIEPYVDSYCNYINTTSGGTHLTSVQESIWKFFMKKTNEILSDREKEKYKILKVDVTAGLNLVVNIFTDMQMQLVGQTKNEVSSDALVEPIRNLTTEALEEYYGENKDKLTQITKLIKLNCKARIDASKIKSATIKDSRDKFDKFKSDKYVPCNNEGKAYKELFICEGDSARNCLVDGRDPDTQAFLSFRGVTANGFKRTEATILDNKEWYEYVKLLKTNFGPKFNLNNLYFDKIIIATDSDIDGYGITSGIGAFHALYMPDLVKAGKLYKVIAPLYKLDDKKHPFARDKAEYVSVFQDKIVNAYGIIIPYLDKKTPLKKKEFHEFIYDTQDYPDELFRIAKHFGVNKFLVELVAAYIADYCYTSFDSDKMFADQKFVKGLMEKVQNKFPEVQLKGKCSLRGVVDGRFQSININNRFMRKVEDLMKTYLQYGYLVVAKENGSSEWKTYSIGEFLDLVSKFKPTILSRFKGLGEANSDQLWDTTLNPDTRILIQLTMEDVERDLRIFQKLHGQSKQDLEDRKKMMHEYKIKREDLDN